MTSGKMLLLVISLPLLISGCSAINFISAVWKVAPIINEIKKWDHYANEKIPQVATRKKASSQEIELVDKRLKIELPKSIIRLGKSVGKNVDPDKKRAQNDGEPKFKYLNMITLRDKSNELLGYCIHFDFISPTDTVELKTKSSSSFFYLDATQELSILAQGEIFMKSLCGDAFYSSLPTDLTIKESNKSMPAGKASLSRSAQ